MANSFLDAVAARRTCYDLDGDIPIPEAHIEQMIDRLLLTVPSAFNGQSTRIMLLLGAHHNALWKIVKESLRPLLDADQFLKTERKIDISFAAGYGTVLFFEDWQVVEAQKKRFPLYADRMEEYTLQTSAMHQFALWSALADEGVGASLQHYNPLIDQAVHHRWAISPAWRLMAQMPFGIPLSTPDEKVQHTPLAARRMFYK